MDATHPMTETQQTLTDIELEVATLIGRGKSTEQIAEALSKSIWTIRTHERHIRRKVGFGVDEDRALVLWCARNCEEAA